MHNLGGSREDASDEAWDFTIDVNLGVAVRLSRAVAPVMRAKKHIGVYPFSPEAVSAVASDVQAVEGSGVDKGTIRFQSQHPLPVDVVRALVSARKAQIDG